MNFDLELRRRWRRKGESKDREAAQTSWPPRYFADNQDTYRDAIASMFEGLPDDTKDDLSKLLTPDFVMRSAGQTYNFAQFVEHARNMRTKRVRINIQAVMFLRDGKKLAAQHVICLQQPSGETHRIETLQFVEVHGDGRLAHMVKMPMLSNTCAEWPDC